MKSHFFKLFFLIIAALFITSSKNYSQSSFEGKIKMKIVSDGETHYMDYYTKDNKYKIEMEDEGEKGSSIWDPQNKRMIVLMPSQKMYMEMPLDFSKIKKGDKEDTSENWKENLKNVKFTGNTKTILGYECKEAVYNSDDETVDTWYTSELGTFFSANKNPMMGNTEDLPEEMKEVFKNGFFPMLMVTKDEDGTETSRMEVTDVQKMDLKSSMFEPPADYKKFNMPNMQNLKDLMKGSN